MKLMAFFRSQTFSGALSIEKINEENNERDYEECGKPQLHAVLLSCAGCERDKKVLWNEQDFFLPLLFLLCWCFQKNAREKKSEQKRTKAEIREPSPQLWILLFSPGDTSHQSQK